MVDFLLLPLALRLVREDTVRPSPAPPVQPLREEGAICHDGMSVKERGYSYLRVGGRQIPGEMPDNASKGFPQVSSDPDVNRTMNIVWVLTSSMDMI